jgi:hypothetical protein
MTITLHWWMIPLFLACAGVYFLTRPQRNWGDIVHGLIGMALLFGALLFTAGHYL